MSVMGVKIDQFDLPVCSSFQAKIFNDQLCYEVDLNRFVDTNNIDRQLESGFNFIMDYNEDRQVIFHENIIEEKKTGLASSIIDSDKDQQALIYLNTIGKDT